MFVCNESGNRTGYVIEGARPGPDGNSVIVDVAEVDEPLTKDLAEIVEVHH